MNTKIKELTCCCCGQSELNRQWWNRDTGFGTCNKCALRLKDDAIKMYGEKEGLKYFRQCHGDEGIHFNIKED